MSKADLRLVVDRWSDQIKHTSQTPTSTTDGGGGTYDGMEARITALETHFEYVRRDLDELKAGQADTLRTLSAVAASVDRVSAQMTTDKAEIRAEIAKLPTRSDLTNWKLQWTAIGFAMVALIVGGVIGGLGWLATVIPSATP